MGFQNIPVWDLNGSDLYQTFSSTGILIIYVHSLHEIAFTVFIIHVHVIC